MSKPLEVLKEYWGYEDFRDPQQQIIEHAIGGKDALVLMPTGGGKSLCYQLPALVMEGLTLVISPLIALMKDQIDQLKKRNISAEAIHSGMRVSDIDRILDNAAHGHVKLLYMSPERLKTDMFLARVERMPISLIAIDEAHCVSQWGHDFRPAYLDIHSLREVHPKVPILALTASATKEVVEDICTQLKLNEPEVFQTKFARDNISYVVIHQEAKLEKMVEILSKVSGSAIIYAGTRRQTVEVAQFLQRRSISAESYHAGFTGEQRQKKQEQWLRGDVRVMAATNAFGMGIDKANVRVVMHYAIPSSLEAYYQESGRAGRDGQKAFAVLLYNNKDRAKLEELWRQKYPNIKVLKQVYQALCNSYQVAVGSNSFESYDFDLVKLCKTYKLKPGPTYYALDILAREGWIALSDAVFQPSKIRIKVSKERLYDFQLKQKALDPLIKTFLRTYQGAFQQMVPINENQLAKFLNYSTEQLHKAFRYLNLEGILDYHPRKDKPQISFLQERVAANDLTIDIARYNFLKERALKKLKSMIKYIEDPLCRQEQILRYFDIPSEGKCEHCDICLERTKQSITGKDFDRYARAIEKQLTQRGQQDLDQILDLFPYKERNRVIWCLAFLRDEGNLNFIDGQFTLSN